MIDWFFQTLKSYPEIAIFLSLALGYYFGSFTYKGLGLGAVTATLIAAVIIGQIGITISGPLKPFFFLMFLFAIGYGVGPQFVRGIAQDGVPQALFAAVVCVFCLAAAYVGAKLAGYDVGAAVGLYAGSQTISASMGRNMRFNDCSPRHRSAARGPGVRLWRRPRPCPRGACQDISDKTRSPSD